MKRYIYLILITFWNCFAVAQVTEGGAKNNTIEVKYITYMNKGVPLSRESELLVDNLLNESVYRTDYDSEIMDTSSFESIKRETKNLFKVRRHFQYKYIYVHTSKDLLTSIDWLSSKTVRYEEPLPKFRWNLINETKMVNNYICHKAEVEFRGRKYTAWYTKEIALPFGPWKFYGLPGLILEVQDAKKEYTILAKEINFNVQKNIYKAPDTDLVMTLQEFVSKDDEVSNPNNWEVPPGFVSPKKEWIRDSMEIIYEWEEGANK